MNLHVYENGDEASSAAATDLAHLFAQSTIRNVMVAAGNTPLKLYDKVAEKRLNLSHLNVFVLDEYLGVPPDEPRNCSNLLFHSVAEAWRIPPAQFHRVTSVEADALQNIQAHEEKIARAGGLDVVILGLGQNGHLGFNEPGSAADSTGRIVPLQPVSVEANRQWFEGKYAPDKGVTTGLRVVLAARNVFVLAFGSHKAVPVGAMLHGPQSSGCPASFLQTHPHCDVYLDVAAARNMNSP